MLSRPRLFRCVMAVALAAGAAAIGAVVAPPAQATGNGFWSVSVPADAGTVPAPNDVDGEAVAIVMDAGATASTAFEVTSQSADPIRINVTSAPGISNPPQTRPDAQGKDFPAPNTSNWVLLNETFVDLAPGQTRRIGVSIAVPSDTPSGDYIASALTSGPGVQNPQTLERETLGLQIRFNIQVGQDLTDRLSLSSPTVDGSSVSVNLTNAGNTALDPQLTLQGSATDGTALATEPKSVGDFQPGAVTTLEWTLGSAPASFTITATGGSASADAQWPPEPIDAVVLQPGDVIPPPPDPGDPTALVVVSVIVGLVIAFLLALAVRSRRRRLREARRQKAALLAAAMPPAPALPPGPPVPPPGYDAFDPSRRQPRSVVTGTGSQSIVMRRP